jgi:hypothetical protein
VIIRFLDGANPKKLRLCFIKATRKCHVIDTLRLLSWLNHVIYDK